MELLLTETPKAPTIIEGVPGFGLVGTITTEYLINALKAKKIGRIRVTEVPAMVAIHEGKIMEPIEIYYDAKTNIMIIHVMTNLQGLEWNVSSEILKLAKKVSAKQIISIEGVGAPGADDSHPFFLTNNKAHEKEFKTHKVEQLKEGIVLGVTATMLLQAEKVPVSCIFAQTHSQLPDSKGAANMIEVLDKYLGLKIDSEPLLKQAEEFEKKIKKIMTQGAQAVEQQKAVRPSYLG